MNDPGLAWVAVRGVYERATDHFWSFMEDRSVRFLPPPYAPMFFTTLGQVVAGRDDPAGRRAALAVLGRMYRRFGLQPYHATAVSAALVDTVHRFSGGARGPRSAERWERGCRRAFRLVERAAGTVGDGPQVTVAEVVTVAAAADGVAVVTVRPLRRLRYSPGQAVPVCTPRLPGVWRWLSPANAPRPDGTVEFHVRAVTSGVVSPLLVHEVTRGETWWLGPPVDVGLSVAACGGADLLLAAGGTGLAPLRAMVEQVAVSPGGRRVILVVGARTLFDFYDAVALDKLASAHRRWLTVVPAFSHDPAVEPAARGDLLTVARYHHRPGQAFVVCGPPSLIEAARVSLPATGVTPQDLHLPLTFHPAPAPAPAPS
ncbi:FAD-binding oxidoreductase [Micromonospora sp. WMMD1082]|uniref:FAD-binding oxidoreductase n=1 Tax=Micromonospora sp. WMMD1082 TaxID=3016104 RepID=UPI002417EB8C|nr:FAD-binding oxidoreductase [Micromonospora sp. WMMD1082]MDG4798137.1 FAD-binding oxidoreductase [Micromonospora sp. WMMD1082]